MQRLSRSSSCSWCTWRGNSVSQLSSHQEGVFYELEPVLCHREPFLYFAQRKEVNLMGRNVSHKVYHFFLLKMLASIYSCFCILESCINQHLCNCTHTHKISHFEVHVIKTICGKKAHYFQELHRTNEPENQ